MNTVSIIKKGLLPEALEELLHSMAGAGFFEEGILAGSWVFVLYGSIYAVEHPVRTFDVDFAVPQVVDSSKSSVDLEEIIIGLGYLPVTEQSGWRRYTRKGWVWNLSPTEGEAGTVSTSSNH